MKTSLKLLIVFVEYTESNAFLLFQAVKTVDLNRSNNRDRRPKAVKETMGAELS